MAIVALQRINPLTDPRWAELLETNPQGSVFHTPKWLTALQRTYGYQPTAWTSSGPGEKLRDGLVFCIVDSWLTGRRLVSLPFSDHCQLLIEQPGDLQELLAAVRERTDVEKVKYLELRPRHSSCEFPEGFGPSRTFRFHWLSLKPDLATLYGNLHKDSIQRKVRRAEREGLTCEVGRSESLLHKFYHLLILTRRRHRLPPQPLTWFRNVLDCLGEKAVISVASKANHPAAAIMALRFRDTITYKYGCSDPRLNSLGGMPLLMWRLIENSKQQGLREVDLGRSDENNQGLITFKNRLGADSTTLCYMRCPAPVSGAGRSDWKLNAAKKVFAHMPAALLRLTGEMIYRHIG